MLDASTEEPREKEKTAVAARKARQRETKAAQGLVEPRGWIPDVAKAEFATLFEVVSAPLEAGAYGEQVNDFAVPGDEGSFPAADFYLRRSHESACLQLASTLAKIAVDLHQGREDPYAAAQAARSHGTAVEVERDRLADDVARLQLCVRQANSETAAAREEAKRHELEARDERARREAAERETAIARAESQEVIEKSASALKEAKATAAPLVTEIHYDIAKGRRLRAKIAEIVKQPWYQLLWNIRSYLQELDELSECFERKTEPGSSASAPVRNQHRRDDDAPRPTQGPKPLEPTASVTPISSKAVAVTRTATTPKKP